MRAPLGTLPVLAGRVAALLQFGMYVPRFRELSALMRGQTTGGNHSTNQNAAGPARLLQYDEGHTRL